MTQDTTLAEGLLQALHDRGVREIFGIPGDFALPFFGVIERSGILPCYTLSHEPAVGFAADAAARFRRGPAVAAVTYGAGGLNLLNAVATAYAEKSPVVVLSGAPGAADTGSGLLIHHQAKRVGSQMNVYREVTCDQAELSDPARAPEDIARVLDRCRVESRPVYLEIPRDKVGARMRPVPPPAPLPHADPKALDACVEEIAELLAEAEHPVLMVGVEVRRFGLEPAVARLARKLGLPVVTSMLGRGLLADDDVAFRGTYLGAAGDEEVADLVEGSDALLMLGVLRADTNFAVPRNALDLQRAVLASDGVVSMGYHVYPELPLWDLVDALESRLAPHAPRDRKPPSYPRGLQADDEPITPLDIARAVNDLFAREGHRPVVTDMGDCLFTAMDFEHTALVAPGFYATMGFGVPAAFGVQAVSGERPLVVVGDGAFQMTGWELLNARRLGFDPIVIVMNNQSWEMLRVFQPESRYNDLDDLDFPAIARALGGDGYRAATRRELASALETAVKTSGRFQLVEARIARGVISPTLERFVAGFKRMRAKGGDSG